MKNHTSILRKTLIGIFLLLSNINILFATIITFNNAGGDDLWSNPANWNPASVPGSGDDVVIGFGDLEIDVNINVKSLSISGTAEVDFTHLGIAYIGDLTISGGTVTSTNNIIVNNSLNWTGPSSLTSSSSIELAASSMNVISGSGNRNLYAQLINNGVITHTGGSLRFQSGGSLQNNGTFTFDGATLVVSSGGGGFTNTGVFNKNNTNEISLFAGFDQSGTASLNVNAGTFKLLSDGDIDGTSNVNIASSAILNIGSGAITFGAMTTVSGEGDLEVEGGTVTIECSYNLSGKMKVAGGKVKFNNSSVITIDDLIFSGGKLEGSGDLIVNDIFSWSGSGQIKNTGTLSLANSSSSLLFGSGSRKLYSPIINNGSISHSAGDLKFYPGGSIENNGIYTTNSSTKIRDNGGGTFENNGVINHQGAGTLKIHPDFNNNINGIIKGKETIDFVNLTNLGGFEIDAENGTLKLKEDFDNGNKIKFDFDNTDHGDLVVDGDINLSGILEVTSPTTVPQGNYQIISTTSGTISGTFDTENIPSNFSLVYGSTEVDLLVGLLPVELTKFSAKVRVKNVQLEWQTASEFNSKNFIVEHSQDGITFRAIGEVAAAGTSETIKDYHFTHDTPPNGINYYKLRQQDLDGKFEYSDLRVLSFYNFNNDLSVFPNPTNGSVIIKNKTDKILKLTILELSGKIVYVRKEVTPGAISLDLSHLPKAMYTLEFSDNEHFKYQEKLMILE